MKTQMVRHSKMAYCAVLTATVSLFLIGCNKEEEKKTSTEPVKATPPVAEKAPPPPPPKPVTPPPASNTNVDPGADYIIVEAKHTQPKPDDPVKVIFRGFKVVKAAFDKDKIVDGTAEIEVDLASLASGIGKRDAHLKSPDYLNVGKYAKASVKIDKVKKDGDGYVATATVEAHGTRVTWPLKFQVVEKTAQGIRVKGEHSFKRSELKIGKASDEPVADDMLLKFQVALVPN